MAIDTTLLLRDGNSDLTADESTPTAIDFRGEDFKPMTYFVSVPEVSTSDTLDVTIQGSDNNTDFYTVLTFPQINAVGVFFLEGLVPYRYRRYTANVTGDSTDFGAVKIGVMPAGRYNNH